MRQLLPLIKISDVLTGSHIILVAAIPVESHWLNPLANLAPESGRTPTDRDTGRAPGGPGTVTGSQYGSENW